jgi:hypothetical protein
MRLAQGAIGASHFPSREDAAFLPISIRRKLLH